MFDGQDTQHAQRRPSQRVRRRGSTGATHLWQAAGHPAQRVLRPVRLAQWLQRQPARRPVAVPRRAPTRPALDVAAFMGAPELRAAARDSRTLDAFYAAPPPPPPSR